LRAAAQFGYYDDARVLKSRSADCRLSPERCSTELVRGSREVETHIRAVWAEYGAVRNMHMAAGRWINPEDDLRESRVVVLGAKVAKELFSGIPPVGENISLNGIRFTVIGVLEAKLQLANYNRRETSIRPYHSAPFATSVTPISRLAAGFPNVPI
jgi:putative ABC transport system permease protein